MRQEQIIELLVESGLIKPNSIHINSILPEFYTFAKLVEQATLEKAAGVLRSAIENSDDIVTDLYSDIDPVARRVIDAMVIRILALKTKRG